jgi:uncharacterized protein YbcV (DUF1398 family)
MAMDSSLLVAIFFTHKVLNMFTLDQINDLHSRLGKQTALPEYLKALRAIGVTKYDSFVADGHSEYYGTDSQKLITPPVHEVLAIANTGSQEGMKKHLSLHEQGKTSYIEMSQGLAESGIEKWSFDTIKMTIAYKDKQGVDMLVEALK